MTISTWMMAPSIWMQKAFFDITETDRLCREGEDELRETLGIRIAAVAHAALQFAYATVVVLPLCLVTAIVICSRSSSTGFYTKYGSVLERLALGVIASIASTLCPVIASISVAFDVQQLCDPESFAIFAPIMSHGYLFSFTLPEISKMSFSARILGSARTMGRSLDSFFGSQRITIGLQAVISSVEQRAYRWRLYMPLCIFGRVQNHFSLYDSAFNRDSEEYTDALLDAVGQALREAPIEDEDEESLRTAW